LRLIEADVFQIPQLHKHLTLYALSNPWNMKLSNRKLNILVLVPAIGFLLSCNENSSHSKHFNTDLIDSTRSLDSLSNAAIQNSRNKVKDSTNKPYGLLCAEMIKQITENAINDLKTHYSTNLQENYKRNIIYMNDRLRTYVDTVFMVNPEILMKFRKEFRTLMADSISSAKDDIETVHLKALKKISLIQNKSILFCIERFK
jgi:hypothetical protein